MEWSNMEDNKDINKKGMETSSKILLGIIVCLIFIIILIAILLLNMKQTQTQSTYKITVDGVTSTTVIKSNLLAAIDGVTYINIEEFAKLVGYEYHQGEYKAYTIEENKCYVQGKNETASFYLNEPKVYKLPLNKLEEEYSEYSVENVVRKAENGKMYASIDLIKIAFNTQITENENGLAIFKLDYLVNWYDSKTKEWGYTGIADQNLENQKAILYGYLIVKKENGLYKVIDTNNTKEIILDKYTTIQFKEIDKEFLVTNSLKQVGILNLDGTTKIQPEYDMISLLDKKEELYLVQKNNKYGIVKSGDKTIISTEYDSIGLNNEYFLLDTLIPVCKSKKWGAFDKAGNLIYKVEYEGFGCNKTQVEKNGLSKEVNPVIVIEECNGVVVEINSKYKLLDVTGKELISTLVDAIYLIKNVENKNEYYLLYQNQELNIIEKLIEGGYITKK